MQEIILSEKFNMKADIKEVGDDLLVLITGGNKPHLGAVAFGINALDGSATDDKNIDDFYKLCLPTHRDDFLSDKIAPELSKKLKRNVAVLSGVHVDNIKKEEIEEIVGLVPEFINKILKNC